MKRLLPLALMLGLGLPTAVAAQGRSPAGSLWVAESLDGVAFARTSRPTLQITPDGKASGTAGCNRYMGAAQLDGATLTFGPLAMTRMACFGAGGDNERRYAPAIAEATGWHFEGRALVVETGKGVLRFRRR